MSFKGLCTRHLTIPRASVPPSTNSKQRQISRRQYVQLAVCTGGWLGIRPNTSVAEESSELSTSPAAAAADFKPVIRSQDIVVFGLGIVPFAWATVEFWRRVLRGEVFGTGKDSVLIPNPMEENDSKGGGRMLTTAALNTAFFLFIIAGSSLLLALFAFIQAGVK